MSPRKAIAARRRVAAVLGTAFVAFSAMAGDPPVTPDILARAHVHPLGPSALHRVIEGRTITFRSLTDNAEETFYYGAVRVDEKGRNSGWGIVENGFIEQAGDAERLVQIYFWHKRYYACSDGVCRRVIRHEGKPDVDLKDHGNSG